MAVRIVLILALLSVHTPAQVFRSYTSEESLLDKINLTRRRELVKQYRADGSLESESEYHNGRRDGLTREYYSNGKIKAEIYFKNGRENGIARFYYPTGIIQKKITYERGKIEELSIHDKRGRRVSQ